MSIEKITSKIIEGGETAKSEALNAAKLQCDTILSEAKQKADKILEAGEVKANEEKEKMISRGKSVAGIDARKVLLAKKQELIESCFKHTEDALIGMKGEDYFNLLAGLGKNSGVSGGTLIFNEKDRSAFGQKVVDTLNKAVDGGNFKLADEAGNMKGGYIITAGDSFVNCTVESIVDQFRGELTGEIAKVLFPDEK